MASSSSNAGGTSSALFQTLELVRNSEEGQAPASAVAMLERVIGELWQRILALPDSYLMSGDEFAVFNYYRARFSQGADEAIAKKATDRFWHNHRSVDGS